MLDDCSEVIGEIMTPLEIKKQSDIINKELRALEDEMSIRLKALVEEFIEENHLQCCFDTASIWQEELVVDTLGGGENVVKGELTVDLKLNV